MRIEALIFDLGDTLIEQIVDSEHSLDKLNVKLLPGVKPVLRKLHENYRIGLVTNTTQSGAVQILRVFQKLSISSCFDAIISSYDVGFEKPDERIFLKALQELGVSPQNAVMVGNDRAKDIEPAKRLGIRSGYFTKSIDPSYHSPDFQFTSYLKLPAKLRELNELKTDVVLSVAERALSDEKDHKWEEASRSFLQVAFHYKEAREFEKAADFFMRAAISSERCEDWRKIGHVWIECASALEKRVQGPVTDLYDEVEYARHFFPTLDRYAWERFSHYEKVGRAYRNAAYHLEKCGSNQTAYVQYKKAGDAFCEGELLAEASRTYYHALLSFIEQHGEMDQDLFSKLERVNTTLAEENRKTYTKRRQLYYRGLSGKLIEKGNYADADKLFGKESEVSRELAREDRRYIKWTVFTLWKYSSNYGNSFWLWTSWAFLLFVIVFPLIFRINNALVWQETDRAPNWFDYIYFSLATVTTAADPSFYVGLFGKFIVTVETVVGFLMLGALVVLLAKKIIR
jgi:HAD superfamily hydrolase (TIGR01509 family)